MEQTKVEQAKAEQGNDVTVVPSSVRLPRFLNDMVLDAAAKNARSFTGEVVWRLSASFGVMPDGTARAPVEGGAA